MGNVAKAYTTHKGMLVVLAVTCVLSFVSMVVSAYAADHIHKTSCSSEPESQSAYKASWRYAALTGVMSACTAAGAIYLIVSHVMANKK